MAKLYEGDVIQDDKGVLRCVTTINRRGVFTSPPSLIRSSAENLELFIELGTHKLFRQVKSNG